MEAKAVLNPGSLFIAALDCGVNGLIQAEDHSDVHTLCIKTARLFQGIKPIIFE